MLKYSIYIIVCIALIIGAISLFHLTRVALRNKKEMSQYMNRNETYNNNLGKTLVVYYSLTGKTEEIAKQIQQLTNADIYEIKTVEKFKPNFFLYSKIKKQLKTKQYPQIESNLPDFSKYDTIFVGGPVWWYTMATPLSSFLKIADFAGKRVIPFSTQGSNPGKYLEDFNIQSKNAKVSFDYKNSFNNLPSKYDEAVRNKIIVWLNSIKE